MKSKKRLAQVRMRSNITNITSGARMRRLFGGVCIAVAICVSAAILPACNTDSCADNRSALPLMGFYSSSTGAQIVLDSIALGGVGAPGDSLLVSPGESVLSLYLPFRFEKTSTSFFIHYDYKEQGLDNPAFDDIVTFHYTSRPYFASEECGAYYQYMIDRVEYTTHLVDSVVVLDSLITNVDMERIRVYIRTAGGDDAENGGEDNAAWRARLL